jgi:hypothetical protein
LHFTRALIGWALQLVLLKGLLDSMGSVEVPLLDLVAYGGYLFAGLSLAVVARLIWAYSYYVVMPWMSLCMGVLGQDNEEDALHRDEEQRAALITAALFPSLHDTCTVSLVLVAW